jgi:acetolactate synthase-1/2/3 large subunit
MKTESRSDISERITNMTAPRSGGRILVDQLHRHGVSEVFCVPGESYLAVLDALHDAPIRTTVCRQEGGAAMMADALGKLTGRPGIAFVTRAPGATNAAHGVHIAQHDSTPLILFVGQVARSMIGRGAFQEVDYRKMFDGGVAKWAVEIDDPARIPETISRAFYVATSGRPGPVVIALPEDVLSESTTVADAPPFAPVEIAPAPSDMAALAERLAAAAAPMVVVGGSRWSEKARAQLVGFAERFDLPVAVEFRCQMLFPADHPNYAGELGLGANPRLLARVAESDLLLAVCARLAETPTQHYTLLPIPGPGTRLVHVHPGPEEIGRVYAPAQAIVATPVGFADALETLVPPERIPWTHMRQEANAEYRAWSEAPPPHPGDLQMAEIMGHLRSTLPADAIIANGAGNYTLWVHRYHRHTKFNTQLAPTSGSMGYGVPAAVAAKRMLPERTVVAFAGDGCFLMNGQEFATAVQYGLGIIVIVIDNAMLGTIRMHQERNYPGRVTGTDLVNPDFAAYARAFGGHGETVRTSAEFAPAFDRALASGKPAILHCHLDPEVITPTMTLSALRGNR